MRSKCVLNKNTNLDLRTQNQKLKKKNQQTAIQHRILQKRPNHISINEAIKFKDTNLDLRTQTQKF